MPRSLHSVGFAFLLSILIVGTVSLAATALFGPNKTPVSTACYEHYSVACLF